MKLGGLRTAAWTSLASAGLLTAGCASSPTYGTGVSANQQLISDVSGILSVAPKEREAIAYQPRPDLVRPGAPGQGASLPAPQQRLARADNPDWPESPEQRRARVRAEATENANNPFYEPEVTMDGTAEAQPRGRPLSQRTNAMRQTTASSSDSRDAVKKRLAERNQGSPTTRKYLSEPPLTYRQPADTAPTDDIGEDEWKKEKRLREEARKKSGRKGGWFDWLPGV